MTIVALSACPENTQCVLVESKIPESLKLRLMGMGWLPGRKIRVLRRAPLGDPTIYLVDSTKISLRFNESSKISVNLMYPAPLSVVGNGSYRISEVSGGPRFRDRAASIGMVKGAGIDVISNRLKGKLSTEINGRKIEIGRGFSEKVFVEPQDA